MLNGALSQCGVVAECNHYTYNNNVCKPDVCDICGGSIKHGHYIIFIGDEPGQACIECHDNNRYIKLTR